MTTPSLPGCLFISGLPATGKSTIGKAIAERIAPSARICEELVDEMIVNGWVAPLGGDPAMARRQRDLATRNRCSLADNFADAGYFPVVEHLILDRGQLDLVRASLRTRPLLLVVLTASMEVRLRRNTERPPIDQVPPEYVYPDDAMRRELGGAGWWLDNSALTVEVTAELVLAEAAERAIVR
jgi:adenylylsulfate kinase-like enzyme